MKHGIAFRKLSRTSAHRDAMLRNMVTSLVEHEQIKTTVPKAKEVARLANKIITLGKKGTMQAKQQAAAFLRSQPLTLPKLFGTLAERYADRPGGYTRIMRIGNRFGDNAPMALLEYVDNPNDAKMHMTAKAIAAARFQGIDDANMHEATQWNKAKVLKFGGEDRRAEFQDLIAKEMHKLRKNSAMNAANGVEGGNINPTKRIAGMKVFKGAGGA